MEQGARRVTYVEEILEKWPEVRKMIKAAYVIKTLTDEELHERYPALESTINEAMKGKGFFESILDDFSSPAKLEETMERIRKKKEEMERIDAEVPFSKLLEERA